MHIQDLRKRLMACPVGLWLFMLAAYSPTADSRDGPPVTLQTATAVREAFEKTVPVSKDSGSLAVPAIVSERLFTRFFAISKSSYPQGGDASWVKQQFALGRQGIGRYFVFAGDHTLIEKALIAGQYNPDQIMTYLGYGAGVACATNQFYWLVVFRPKSKPLSAVYQQNLKKWLNHVYGIAHSPEISDDVVQSFVTHRFSALTGCPVDPSTGAFQWSNLEACATEFKDTVTALNDKKCANPNALTYSPSNQCPTDKVLQSFGPQPSTLQLRAWLFATNNFSEFFTGNGYAGNFYNTPANREYWVDNAWLRKLPEAELIKLQCQNPSSLQLAPISDPWLDKPPAKPYSAIVDEY